MAIEKACEERGINTDCVLSSEIKKPAVKTYEHNFDGEDMVGNIREVDAKDIPDFELLAAGFPCQAFSAAGNREGFLDTRGTLFFEIERILEAKQPYGFILENVPGLVTHDREDKSNEIGRTLRTILRTLEDMGYHVTWQVKNATDFGIPQDRDRVFIVGTQDTDISLEKVGGGNAEPKLKDVLESGQPTLDTKLANQLTTNFEMEELYGKAIKDTRGGPNNLHSWDLEIRGETNQFQRKVLSELLRQRRRKKWARNKGIEWMDGMPLTEEEIRSFMKSENLEAYSSSEFSEKLDNIEAELQDLVEKGYLSHKYPKDLVEVETDEGDTKKVRKPDESCKKGYDISTGNLSFDIRRILDPEGTTPTLVATDMDRLVVADNGGLRKLTPREGLRLSGFPEWFELPVEQKDAYDLIGNTVPAPIVEAISGEVLEESNLITDNEGLEA